MPDYLGKDQRTVRGDEEKNDKPIQGSVVGFLNYENLSLPIQFFVWHACFEIYFAGER